MCTLLVVIGFDMKIISNGKLTIDCSSIVHNRYTHINTAIHHYKCTTAMASPSTTPIPRVGVGVIVMKPDGTVLIGQR